MINMKIYFIIDMIKLCRHCRGCTVCAKYMEVHKINNLSCNYLGSFFIEKLSLKMPLINKKTAEHTTDPP